MHPNATHGCIVYDWELTAKDVHRWTLPSQSIRAFPRVWRLITFCGANYPKPVAQIFDRLVQSRKYFRTSQNSFDWPLKRPKGKPQIETKNHINTTNRPYSMLCFVFSMLSMVVLTIFPSLTVFCLRQVRRRWLHAFSCSEFLP